MDPVMSGLEGVVVAETQLSDVRGDAGRLVIAGADVETLAGRVPLEDVAAMMMPRLDFGRGRARAWNELALPPVKNGMNALRAAVARLEADDTETIVGAVAVFAAAWSRGIRGLEPLAPDPSLGHAADYLRMLTGQAREPLVRAMDAYLVTVIDHGMNASTFTARVIASTGSDLVSAVSGAIGALKGPLHGGAPGPVLEMLDAIGIPREAFSPTFAVSRVCGWCAHVLEQRKTGRLIRPLSRYVGPAPGANLRND
jgi:citrate synthase